MSDSKYFGTTKKGEIPELKAELMNENKKRKIAAMKKIIANMTLGNDMSSLFPEVLAHMQTNVLELKKMVYLYVITYAKLKPELALMTVNSFIRDTDDTNPLIRGLAIRTMGYIHVDKITEALTEPLRKCLKDEDAYVRKTAALNVAKLYEHERELVNDQGFLDTLRDLLSDANSMVVANAMAALTEIDSVTENGINLEFNFSIVMKMLTALQECSEWGQTYFLESLVLYDPQDAQEAETIAERVAPRLFHSNGAVVLSAVKLIMHCMPHFSSEDIKKMYCKKMSPPLVTLLRCDMPEVQYVTLRNVLLLIQKRPDILIDELKVFFCEYNDPIFVKLAKLEIMIRKTTDINVELVLSELKEYSSEVDIDFVRKSVRAIGICAIKVERAADRCIDVLLELIQTKVSYVVQEAVVVIKDIFRKYPNRYENIIGTLCENLDTLDEPEAKASMIWIIGQYADRIENSHELMEQFAENFLEEPVDVQLALLTATVKLFLMRPSESEQLIKKIFKWVTEGVENPDLRDRGFIYWRLLSADPMAAKAVVLSEKPLRQAGVMDNLEPALLDELMFHIGSLASVYHKPPSAFLGAVSSRTRKSTKTDGDEGEEVAASRNTIMPSDAFGGGGDVAPRVAQVSVGGGANIMNLLDLDVGELESTDADGGMYNNDNNSSNSVPGNVTSGLAELNFGSSTPTSSLPVFNDVFASEQRLVLPKKVMLTAAQALGLEINGTFARRSNKIFLDLTFTNRALQPMADFAFQFNTNAFGIVPGSTLQVRSPLPANQSAETSLPMVLGGQQTPRDPINNLQIAVKNNISVFYFQTGLPLHILFVENPEVERSEYLKIWRDIPDENERVTEINGFTYPSLEALRNKLQLNNVITIAERQVDGRSLLYTAVRLQHDRSVLLTEINVDPSLRSCLCSSKTFALQYVSLLQEALTNIIRHGQ